MVDEAEQIDPEQLDFEDGRRLMRRRTRAVFRPRLDCESGVPGALRHGLVVTDIVQQLLVQRVQDLVGVARDLLHSCLEVHVGTALESNREQLPDVLLSQLPIANVDCLIPPLQDGCLPVIGGDELARRIKAEVSLTQQVVVAELDTAP